MLIYKLTKIIGFVPFNMKDSNKELWGKIIYLCKGVKWSELHCEKGSRGGVLGFVPNIANPLGEKWGQG